jgi:hypothetical protein
MSVLMYHAESDSYWLEPTREAAEEAMGSAHEDIADVSGIERHENAFRLQLKRSGEWNPDTDRTLHPELITHV